MAYDRQTVQFLHDHGEDIAQLAPQLQLRPAAAVRDAALVRAQFGDYGRAVMELLRARASGKLPDSWLMDSDSVQQATPGPVASFRAQWFAGAGVRLAHDITCSVGTEGAALTDVGVAYLGTDLDPSRALMAQINLRQHTAAAPAWVAVADALAPVSRGSDVLIADPARRSGGRRISDPQQLQPPLSALLDAGSRQGAQLAVKCAPGLDFSHWPGLVALSSIDGGVKEACLISPELGQALAPGARRVAVLLRTTAPGGASAAPATDWLGRGYSSDVLSDAELGEPAAQVAPPGRYIIDPDGAVVRAGLVRHYAHREQLWQLDERIAYLSGDRIPAGESGFEYLETTSVKQLKSVLSRYQAGALEILVRGVDIDPDQLRKKLKCTGTNAMTVVLTRVGRGAVALVCGPRQWA